jgi:hypothetical protein
MTFYKLDFITDQYGCNSNLSDNVQRVFHTNVQQNLRNGLCDIRTCNSQFMALCKTGFTVGQYGCKSELPNEIRGMPPSSNFHRICEMVYVIAGKSIFDIT